MEKELLEITAVQEFTGAGSLTDDDDEDVAATATAAVGMLSSATEHKRSWCSSETVTDGTAGTDCSLSSWS